MSYNYEEIAQNSDKHPVIFFDGYCNLCNSSVDFIVRHDRKRKFRFASLQSEAAKHLIGDGPIALDDPSSFVLYINQKQKTQSTAALRVLTGLGLPYCLAGIFFIVPRFIRNWAYRKISKNRYAWFGKKETCRLPTEEERGLFYG